MLTIFSDSIIMLGPHFNSNSESCTLAATIILFVWFNYIPTNCTKETTSTICCKAFSCFYHFSPLIRTKTSQVGFLGSQYVFCVIIVKIIIIIIVIMHSLYYYIWIICYTKQSSLVIERSHVFMRIIILNMQRKGEGGKSLKPVATNSYFGVRLRSHRIQPYSYIIVRL